MILQTHWVQEGAWENFLQSGKSCGRRKTFDNQNIYYKYSWYCQSTVNQLCWSQHQGLPSVEGTSDEIFKPDTERENACELQGNGSTSMAVLEVP